MIGSGVDILVDRPDYWQAMHDDPALAANVVEETLRIESPVQMTPRIASEDMQFLGFDVPAGARVMSVLAAANRDPDTFPDPTRFDPWRANANRHVSFVVGPHHCLGSSLARLEGVVAFRSLLARMPEIRRAAPAVRRPNFIARGLTNLPVAFAKP
jgi:cytochrome P450